MDDNIKSNATTIRSALGLLGFYVDAGIHFLDQEAINIPILDDPPFTLGEGVDAQYDASVLPDTDNTQAPSIVDEPPPAQFPSEVRLPDGPDEDFDFHDGRLVSIKNFPFMTVHAPRLLPKKADDPVSWTARAVMHDIQRPSEALMFAGTKAVRIIIRTTHTDDSLVEGPFDVAEKMVQAQRSGFAAFDAVIEIPGSRHRLQYFFNGIQCAWALYDISSSLMFAFGPPRHITFAWQSLREVGFTTIDAVIPSPEGAGYFYFFLKSEYAYIKVTNDMQDEKITGPKSIWEDWPSIRATGFTTIDAALQSPENADDGYTYIFSEDQYALISVCPCTTESRLIQGPRPVAQDWPSLRQAGFY